MSFTLNDLLARALDSLRAPRDQARWIMSLDMPRSARWEVLLLIVVLSVILAQVSIFLAPDTGDIVLGPILSSPAVTGVVQMSLLVISVFAIFWVGRAAGGQGGFGDTILMVAFLQFVMACLQVVQTAILLMMPPLAGLIGIFGFVLFFWLLTNFIAELHGFKSLTMVFVMILVTMMVLAFGFSLILTMIGFSVPGGPV